MERRGRIPVAKFRTQEGKTRSRSRVREPDYNEQDPETDLFTLLEDNIALKEENKALKLELEDHKKIQNELLEENSKMSEQLEAMKKQHSEMDMEIKSLTAKFQKVQNERNALDKLHKMKAENITSLSQELQLLKDRQENMSNAVVCSHSLKSKLLKLLPTLATTAEMESIIEADTALATPLTSELVEKMVDEFMALKTSMNSVELQLYEANEKIAELIENQHHLDEENETLRTENTNLTKVAKLLTENMKESVETSKKMEAALIKLKQRNDELVAKTRDATDGVASGDAAATAAVSQPPEFEQIKEEVESQNRDHNERIVEMQKLLDAAIEKTTNDELKTLQLKLSIMEDELRKALARADAAENELAKLKNANVIEQPAVDRPIVAPPPPPPMPESLLYKPTTPAIRPLTSGQADASFSDSIAKMHDLQRNNESGGEGVSQKLIETVKQQVQPEAATGLDALVREFKSGRVTLRRNRRKTHTNEALQEMFQVLEISQKQNRNSKICVDLNRMN
ncbi:myosin-2 heavy chain, non muscle [Musca vetustissima]|uniref:myosin-2 heavy chain, non muscle n=1 Tax=Musca vetustissima TaxID=27455 RepID=UPI002AB7ABE3|nr:myosin-2 heavy chain, non muscle [Musca vetustissima]